MDDRHVGTRCRHAKTSSLDDEPHIPVVRGARTRAGDQLHSELSGDRVRRRRYRGGFRMKHRRARRPAGATRRSRLPPPDPFAIGWIDRYTEPRSADAEIHRRGGYEVTSSRVARTRQHGEHKRADRHRETRKGIHDAHTVSPGSAELNISGASRFSVRVSGAAPRDWRLGIGDRVLAPADVAWKSQPYHLRPSQEVPTLAAERTQYDEFRAALSLHLLAACGFPNRRMRSRARSSEQASRFTASLVQDCSIGVITQRARRTRRESSVDAPGRTALRAVRVTMIRKNKHRIECARCGSSWPAQRRPQAAGRPGASAKLPASSPWPPSDPLRDADTRIQGF